MPSVNDPCPSCRNGIISECEPGECISCRECGWHDAVEEEDFLDVEFDPDVAPGGAPPPESVAPTWDYESLSLPSGVLWYRYPDRNNVGQLYIERPQHADYLAVLTALREWAEANDLVLEPISSQLYTVVTGGYQRLPNTFDIRPASVPSRGISVGWEDEFECPICEETHPAYTAACTDGTAIRCGMCLMHRGNLRNVEGMFACPDCVRECEHEGCEVLVYDTPLCEEHGHFESCSHCGYEMQLPLGVDFDQDANGRILCGDCAERCCPECGVFSTREFRYSEALGMYVCRRCQVGGDGEEAFDEDAERELRVPAIPGRENIRLCGVEIEGGDGTGTGSDLALAFHNKGLSEWDRMGSYHSGSEGGFAHVERDSSVDWEAVIGPIDFANSDDTEALNAAVKSIRKLVREGVLTLDLRAGCHIHVEAARTSLDGAYNLNLLFAYLEDVIFRLAAARWPVHRAIQDMHYTAPIPKELRKVQFARHHAEGEQSRYYALSFNNYFQQMLSRCRCGATRYDSWEDCTCSLGKCTFEFRVFNTTANPRKLHAYLALCQALVAKAMSLGKIEEGDEFPALAFVQRRFKDMDEPAQTELVESWRDRLEWMFRELPLTEDEKESLAYCIRHSELESIGEDFINNVLLPEQQVIEEVTA